MTQPDATSPDVCPICGSILIDRGNALYCASCDLFYEEDDHSGGGSGQDGGSESLT
ncbi:hypothetical protein GCM10022288_05060 [Gryllotalpicola kribbensis]|jgi:hypothetical protein|uniref:Uncharacterized protein n=1 Tax=Gryllotalpicola kribbensis TaxID=993084 RepID=A0ABP8AII1_9MICO